MVGLIVNLTRIRINLRDSPLGMSVGMLPGRTDQSEKTWPQGGQHLPTGSHIKKDVRKNMSSPIAQRVLLL